MIGKFSPAVRGKLLALAAGFLAVTWSVSTAAAQPLSVTGPAFPTEGAATESKATPASSAEGSADSFIQQAGCSSCGGGGGLMGAPYESGGYNGCCGSGDGGCRSCCHAGRKPCDCCFGDGPIGRCLGGVYECMCCPDPCYEPSWIPVANSAFFVDAARPVTQMKFIYDAGFNFTHFDRSEYFAPRFRVAPNALSAAGQVGPAGPCVPANTPGKGPACIPGSVDYSQFSIYNEGAIGGFGLFMQYGYEHLDPTTSGISPMPCCPTSAFDDLIIGTKSLLLDCELVNLTFQFKTFIPVGNFTKGIGTGHVSLEPSILGTVKITPTCYFQGQTSYWIPIGGDQLYDSNIWHSHWSFNKILCKPCTGCQLIGTLEFNDWIVFQGAYTGTDFLIGGVAPPAISATTGIFSMGPGVRAVICNNVDFGVGSAFSLTGDHWAQQLIRSEVRWRF